MSKIQIMSLLTHITLTKDVTDDKLSLKNKK